MRYSCSISHSRGVFRLHLNMYAWAAFFKCNSIPFLGYDGETVKRHIFHRYYSSVSL